MRRPRKRKAAGIGVPPQNAKGAGQGAFSGKADTSAAGFSATRGPDVNGSERPIARNGAACMCRLNLSGCLCCRRWNKVIRNIEARRAASSRRQSAGEMACAGGVR